MKRFYKDVAVETAQGSYRVVLDGRPVRTQGGNEQLMRSRCLAEAMAAEWRNQGEKIDPTSLIFRDLADYAIDRIAPDRDASIERLLPYGETDTLCYRADPEEPLYRRQQEIWEPLLRTLEKRHDVRLERVSGVIHKPQSPEALHRLREVLGRLDPFELAALETLVPLAASLTLGLEALEADADAEALFAAANCEQDWQAELWGWDTLAEDSRATRLKAFAAAIEFLKLLRENA